MRDRFTINRIPAVSPDREVRDFDELTDRSKEYLVRAVSEGDRHRVDRESIPLELVQYDVIKFTEYLEVVPAHSSID